jgi:ornithine carbamoyltransferase
MSKRRKHLISIGDLSDDQIKDLIRLGCHYADRDSSTYSLLNGRVLGTYFRITSTRTRTAFSVAAQRLGAALVCYGTSNLQIETGESIEDTARVLSGMLDGLVVRDTGNLAELRTWSRAQDDMAIINAMNADEHPTQAIADLTTMFRRFNRVDGLRVLYVGDGNSTAAALALALSRFPGVELEIRTPPGAEVPTAVIGRAVTAAELNDALVTQQNGMSDLPKTVDVVYTTRWQTTGIFKSGENWRSEFFPYRVGEQLMGRYPAAVFMHDLPAHRGQEVEGAVIDGPRSIAFDQAWMKMYSAMAVLHWCIAGSDNPV